MTNEGQDMFSIEIKDIIQELKVPSQLLGTIGDVKQNDAVSFQEVTQKTLEKLRTALDAVDKRLEIDDAAMQEFVLFIAAISAVEIKELSGQASWSTLDLAKMGQHLLLRISISENEIEEKRGVLEPFFSFLPQIFPILKERLKSNYGRYEEETFQKVEILGSSEKAILSSFQLAWLISKMDQKLVSENCHKLVPCVLTALDHFSPIVQKSGLISLQKMLKFSTFDQIRWFGEVALDATCHFLVGCEDEIWPMALETSVQLAIQFDPQNPRSKWYNKIFDLTILDMERRGHEKYRRIQWTNRILPLVTSSGIYILAHTKRLMPLLYFWINSQDSETVLQALKLLSVIIKFMGPRIKGHKLKIMEEMEKLKNCKRFEGSEEILKYLEEIELFLSENAT